MNKIIIITRTDAYIDSGIPKGDRERYGNQIIKELNGETNFSDSKNAVKTFLAANKKINDEWEKKDFPALSTFLEEKYNIFDLGQCETDYDIRAEGIKGLINQGVCDVADFIDKKCYVCFTSPLNDNDKVILLLWDVLDQGKDEKIVPLGLFVEKLSEDLDVRPEDSNILYIHDKQFGNNSDETILNKFNGIFPGEYKIQPYYSTLEKCFGYVATFRHQADFGNFQNYILKFKFIPTLADIIAEEEAKADSFQSLRENADKLSNQNS